METSIIDTGIMGTYMHQRYHGYSYHRFVHHGFMHHRLLVNFAWVTPPECPKGVKDEVKKPEEKYVFLLYRESLHGNK